MKIDPEILHYYRHARQHQLATYGDSGLYIAGRSARQFTGGGACYGQHAYAAYIAAKRHRHFLQVNTRKGRA